jgi:hypothetical protein
MLLLLFAWVQIGPVHSLVSECWPNVVSQDPAIGFDVTLDYGYERFL